MPRFVFGPFLLDLESRALLRDGEPLPIAGRTLDTLVVLVQNRGRLVAKDDLLSLIWPGTVVEEANLSQSIFALRKLLGDNPKDHRYIATIPGRGYQFVAPVAELAAETLPPLRAVDKPPSESELDPATVRSPAKRHGESRDRRRHRPCGYSFWSPLVCAAPTFKQSVGIDGAPADFQFQRE